MCYTALISILHKSLVCYITIEVSLNWHHDKHHTYCLKDNLFWYTLSHDFVFVTMVLFLHIDIVIDHFCSCCRMYSHVFCFLASKCKTHSAAVRCLKMAPFLSSYKSIGAGSQ